MDPELQPELRPSAITAWPAAAARTTDTALPSPASPELAATTREISAPGDPSWVWRGRDGLRAGWSLALFATLVYLLASIFGTVLAGVVELGLHWKVAPASASSTILGESGWVAALVASMLLLSLVERRSVTDYFVADRQGVRHFLSGGLAGFAALSVLVAGLAEGGWLRFGPVGLSGLHIVKYGLLWGLGFLFVGIFEEGTFRCYVQFTLTRGVNFWWAGGLVAAMCAYLVATPISNGVWGIYAMGLLGAGPCLWLEVKRSPSRGFWQAAWAGSTAFGFIHTFNRGETWIGIFAAAAIGFVFCVSVRVTGSAWWAVGCHTAWDWAESFFYGTADSGFVAKGHYLSTLPAGPPRWSGGSDGPEGSLLVLPVIGFLLLVLLLLYRRHPSTNATA